MTPRAFYRAYIDAARRNEAENGVPALFTLAQSALETGWGRHAPGNMMFGIKAGPGWTGKRQLCTTREVFSTNGQGNRFPQVISIKQRADGKWEYVVKDWFRAYDDPFESFRDHARMLRSNKRYAAAFTTKDPRAFALHIAAGGYATDPGYAVSLHAMIDTLEKAAAKEDGAPAPVPAAPPAPLPGALPEGYRRDEEGNVVAEEGRKSKIEDGAEKGGIVAGATAAAGAAGGAATLFKAVPPWAAGVALCILAIGALAALGYFLFIRKRRRAMSEAGVV